MNTLSARRLPAFKHTDWPATAATFQAAPACQLQQGWRDTTEPRFRPATVRTGWTDDALAVYAVLSDDDIFNPVVEFNVPAFKHGDVFEIFLRPAGQEAYFEFHVSPTGHLLQLRFPNATAVEELRRQVGKDGADLLTPFKIDHPKIEAHVSVRAADREWRVLALIPTALVSECGPVAPDTEWRFSFSRYDYTRGESWPVLSSTSPHRQLDFHRQQEWGRLRFA